MTTTTRTGPPGPREGEFINVVSLPPIECLRLLPLQEQIAPCPRFWCCSIHAAAQAAERARASNRENLD